MVYLNKQRGSARAGTSVTTGQLELLLAALAEVNEKEPKIVEIGSYRAATTIELARNTKGKVYAVDPFSGYGGSEEDFRCFQAKVEGFRNVVHMRETSGNAARCLDGAFFGLVFIDGVHDFSNSWFDFCAWSGKLVPGGLIAFHDVDDHPGVRLAVKNVVRKSRQYRVWGYCPNLIVLKKEDDAPHGSADG